MISFNIIGSEFPVGPYSTSERHGGELINHPTEDIVYEFDMSYDDYAYKQYVQIEESLECYRKQIIEMSSRDLELFVGNLFKKLRYNVKVTQATRDGVQDLIVTQNKPIFIAMIVECKYWTQNHKMDVSVTKSVYGVQTVMQANKSVIATSSKFTKNAQKFVENVTDQ